MRAGERLYTGAIASAQFAATYNAATAKIDSFAEAGRAVPENLLNGRHNLLAAFAHKPQTESK